MFILPTHGIFPRQITGKFCHGLNNCLFCTYKPISLDVKLNNFSKVKCFDIISTIKTLYIMNTGMPYIMQHCTVIFRHICCKKKNSSYTITIASETYDPVKQDKGTAHSVTVKHYSPQSDLITQQSAKTFRKFYYMQLDTL